MTTIGEYVYDHVSSSVLKEDMAFSQSAPRPGDRLPDFDLQTTRGDRIKSADLVGQKPILVITGSYTCPMTASSNPILKDLHSQFGSAITFVMLHVREAHPGEQREQPRRFEEKMRHAKDLQERDRLPWPIAVDDIDGTVHRALDNKPNAVYLTDRDGEIVYRGLWAGDEAGLVPALESVQRGEIPEQQDSQRRLVPMAMGIGKMREITQQSGPRAAQDLWTAAPPVAALAWLADLYRPLPPKWRTIAAAGTIAVAATVIISAVRKQQRY
ncbi:MAG: redoxin domain-containing protein [Alphaproteobacteria bacterium]|nr:redoxin domain-containing protein [Alphaproteobacteria bacterium]